MSGKNRSYLRSGKVGKNVSGQGNSKLNYLQVSEKSARFIFVKILIATRFAKSFLVVKGNVVSKLYIDGIDFFGFVIGFTAKRFVLDGQ